MSRCRNGRSAVDRRADHADRHAWLFWLASGWGATSIALTGAQRLAWWAPLPSWTAVEVPILCLLAGAVARWVPARRAVIGGLLAGTAAAIDVLRLSIDMSLLGEIYGVAFWGLGPICCGAAGGFLRAQDTKRRRMVLEARRAQRLELARDLHDYVAHDVSEMVAQAQAARLLPADPAVLATLRRIERAGLNAMSSMDRTVHMLHDAPVETRPLPGIRDLPAVRERFAEASSAVVRLTVDPDFLAATTRELDSTVYRVVLEALTNVRRHAPKAATVTISVVRSGDALEVTVNNSSGGEPTAGRTRAGGLGLAALGERVAALGGVLRAGPSDDGWRLLARFPVTR